MNFRKFVEQDEQTDIGYSNDHRLRPQTVMTFSRKLTKPESPLKPSDVPVYNPETNNMEYEEELPNLNEPELSPKQKRRDLMVKLKRDFDIKNGNWEDIPPDDQEEPSSRGVARTAHLTPNGLM